MPVLNPLLETDKIECIHKGKVLLQSSTKDLMCVQDSNGTDAGVISLQDLANAVIIGCTNNIAGIPNPCTKLVSIPNSITSSLLEIDNQKIVLAQTISQVITDKGSPLILQGEPKAKDILELDEDITENAQNTQSNNIKSISESSPKSSNQSNAGSNESNAKSSNESSSKSSKNSNKDSQTKKEILEMYFSYGKEMTRLKSDDSRFTKDINLHLATQGYNKGEVIDIELERNNQTFSTQATIDKNGKTIIKNVFDD